MSPPQQNAFEVYFLSCIRFDIDAFNTPSHWVRRLVPAWLGEAADITCSIFIERVAEELIGKFIEGITLLDFYVFL